MTLTEQDGGYRAEIDPMWTIGAKVHGGAMAAIIAAAARRTLHGRGVPMDPLAISLDFQAAPDPGTVDLVVDVRKVGRQISLADVTLSQGGRLAVRASVTLGYLDEHPPVHQTPLDMPVTPAADAIVYENSAFGDFVHVSQAVTLRMDNESAAFARGATGEPELRLWAKPFDGDGGDPELLALLAILLTDMSAPVVFNLGSGQGWCPTVQMTVFLRRRPAPGWFRIKSTTVSVGTNAFDEDHVVVDSTGAVVAQSRQLALIPRRV